MKNEKQSAVEKEAIGYIENVLNNISLQ